MISAKWLAEIQNLRREPCDIFCGSRWESDANLARFDEASDLHLDHASPVRMPHWRKDHLARCCQRT